MIGWFAHSPWSLLGKLVLVAGFLLGGPAFGQDCTVDERAVFSESYDLKKGVNCIVNLYVPNADYDEASQTLRAKPGNSQLQARLQICANFSRNINSDRRVILDPSTISLDGWRNSNYNNNYIILGHQESQTINLVADEEVAVSIQMTIARARETQFARGDWKETQIVTIPLMTIKDLESDEDRFWAANSNSVAGLYRYLEDFGNGKYITEATEKLQGFIDLDFRSMVLNEPTLESVDAFIRKYDPYRSLRAVTDKLAEAETIRPSLIPVEEPEIVDEGPSRQELDRSRFARIKESGDTSLILAYIAEFHQPPTYYARHYEEALDSLLSWRPAQAIFVREVNGWKEYRLKNFAEPAYRDIYTSMLLIDDDQLVSDSLIRVKPLREGALRLEMLDRRFGNKRFWIEVDNSLEARMAFDSVAGEYTVRFSRGIKPYRLVLLEAESRLPVWSLENIEVDEVKFSQAELSEAQLEGDHLLQVFGHQAERPIDVQRGGVLLPALPKADWLTPALIALGLLVVVVILIVLMQKRKRRLPAIIDQV